MAKNPLAAAAGNATLQVPIQEPHARSLHSPTHKAKVGHRGRHPVEMKASHGMRASAVGRDTHRSSSLKPSIPGKRESGGIQRVGSGASRFGNQGAGKTVLQPKASKPHMGPKAVR